MAGVNLLERDLIRMRQREGIELAKKEGKLKGWLKKYHKNHVGIEICSKALQRRKYDCKSNLQNYKLELHYIESYQKGTNSPFLFNKTGIISLRKINVSGFNDILKKKKVGRCYVYPKLTTYR